MSGANGNIDERLQRLVERHEALAESVEMLRDSMQELRKHGEEQNQRIDKILEAVKRDGENIAALARIAEAHERRLNDLEGNEG